MERRFGLIVCFFLLGGTAGAAVPDACPIDAAVAAYPGAEWAALGGDRAKSWSPAKLAEAGAIAGSAGFNAVFVVQHGQVVYQYGDPGRALNVRSIRKSLLNSVLGLLVKDGKISLEATLADLGIGDSPPLSDLEKTARVEHLLMSRSGVYHDAAYETETAERERPMRGSHVPGEFFYYNNWDFNALGLIAERAAGRSLFEEFAERVATPLQMQDFRSGANTRYEWEDSSSIPAYLFDLSARDLARFGLLYLRDGCWRGMQLLPADWVRRSVSPLTDRNGEQDYGYLWWSQEGIKSRGLSERIFLARGSGGQVLWVIPEEDLIIVTNTDTALLEFWDALGLMPDFDDAVAVLYTVLDARTRMLGD